MWSVIFTFGLITSLFLTSVTWIRVVLALAALFVILYNSSRLVRFHVKVHLVELILALNSFVLIPFYLFRPRHRYNLWWGMKLTQLTTLFYGWKVIVRDRENLPSPDKPCVIIVNHQSTFDFLITPHFAPYNSTVWAKREILYFGGPFSAALWLAGGIFVDRFNHASARNTIGATGEEILRKKLALIVFPEGTRNTKDSRQLLPFKKGAFVVALRAQLPVYPVVVSSIQPFVDRRTLRCEPGYVIVTPLPPVMPPPLSIDQGQSQAASSTTCKEWPGSENASNLPKSNGTTSNGQGRDSEVKSEAESETAKFRPSASKDSSNNNNNNNQTQPQAQTQTQPVGDVLTEWIDKIRADMQRVLTEKTEQAEREYHALNASN